MNEVKMQTKVFLNDQISNGQGVNTAVHMAQQAGAERPSVAGQPVRDASGQVHSGIPIWGNVVLSVSSEDLKAVVARAKELAASNPDVMVIDYPEQGFTTATDDEYRAEMAVTPAETLIYYGCLIIGPRKEVDRVSKGIRARLWNGSAS